jgi:spore maturation protein CgeB
MESWHKRFFECLAIGPVLTNYVPDLESTGLIEGEDYLAYRTDAELLSKMKQLVTNPEFAQKIAINGRKKALELHTYEQRLETILSDISSLQ